MSKTIKNIESIMCKKSRVFFITALSKCDQMKDILAYFSIKKSSKMIVDASTRNKAKIIADENDDPNDMIEKKKDQIIPF